ncbi:MAG TPA: GatB/YqeY domain-containing protein [Edaphocola sp.]|nr:GatB/YqeY domain-containing protein [Edaphocola sp.]
MSLESRIMASIIDAMKAKDEVALRTLRAIKSAILLEKTSSGAKVEINEADEIKLLTKMAKQRRESYDIFSKQGREDLAIKEKEELDIIDTYLPTQLSESEIEAEVKSIITLVGASSATDFGKVMGAANKSMAGKADGKIIAEVVKRILQ